MKKELAHFTLFPSVVKADEESVVSVVGDGGYYSFYDDVLYTITIYPMEIHDTPIDEDFTLSEYGFNQLQCYPKDGVISFKYKFSYEQKWKIKICASPEQKKHLSDLRRSYYKHWDQEEMEKGKVFELYSLYEDLYNRRVFVGDLHVHTNHSDGLDNPEAAISNLRGAGYDFCAVTDHHIFDSSLIAKDKCEELDTNFTVFTGEEVHNKLAGKFHVVNFAGKESVNEKLLAEPEKYKKKVEEIAKEIKNLSDSDAKEVAWYKIITDEIRRVGGMSIFAHPFWVVGNTYNCPLNVAKEVFKRGYFDAYEVLGGLDFNENNLETALYYEMCREGIKIPVVGSTDIHNTNVDNWLGGMKTVVFANDTEDIMESIKEGYSTAAERITKDITKAYGDFRLVNYTLFLLENYFPIHDRLCSASGTMMTEYFKGDDHMAEAIAICEKKILETERIFFGK